MQCGCVVAEEPWEIGQVNGARYRMRLPAQWNGVLVMAAGGYSPRPLEFRAEQSVPELTQELVEQGYAYAETAYSSGGLAIAQAIDDVRALRRHFIETHGLPRRTLIIGESKGGLVALVLMETAPSEFDGALAVSGLLSSPYRFLGRAFELLGAFERRVPSVLPSPARVPSTYEADERTVSQVLEALEGNPSAASLLRDQASVRRNEDLAELLAFHTDLLRDLQERCRGNPFVTPGDRNPAAVDSKAVDCARSLPAPTGALQRPLLAVDTEYDPVIPGWSAAEYIALLRKTGRAHLFARRVVAGEGHLTVGAADRIRAFQSLAKWERDGVRPAGYD